MDTWAFLLIAVSVIGYLATKKKSVNAEKFFLFLFGCGLGLLTGAVWAYSIVDRAFQGF